MRLSTKFAALLLVSAMAVTVISACSGKDPKAEESGAEKANPSASKGNTFTYAIAGDPGANVNVITTADRFGLTTIKMIYSPLYMYNADGINYFLAKGIEASEDNLTYTVRLREDVAWSDGEKFTADDVVFTFEAMKKEENAGWAYSQLVYPQGAVQVNKVDDYTVSFVMPFVNSAAEEMFSQVFIMPEHIYKDVKDFENNDFNTKPVGTGPYVMSEYSAGSHVKFTKNKAYFLGEPSIDTIAFRIIENENTAMTAIQSKEVDAWIGTPTQVEQMDLKANNLEVHPYSEGRVGHMMINSNKVQDVRVRQAILYALDKEAIAKASFLDKEYYELPWGFMPPNSEFFTENVEKYGYNPDKAKALLAEAGVSDLELELGYSASDGIQSTTAVIMQEQLQKVGIKLNLSGVDTVALSQQQKDPNNKYDMYYGGYIMGIDPDTYVPLFETGGAYNYMYYDAPAINELFAKGRQETDPEKRKEIYEKVQQEVQNTACFYPLYSNKRLLVVSNNLAGIDEAKLVPVYTFEDTSKLKLK